jgi:hypothetical protein
MTTTENQMSIIPPPPFKYSQFVIDNKGRYSGTFFGGLLPIEIEEYIFWLAWNMGITDFHRLLMTMINNPIGGEGVSRFRSMKDNPHYDLVENELMRINKRRENIIKPYTFPNFPNKKTHYAEKIRINKKCDAYYVDRLSYKNDYGGNCMGSWNMWNDGSVTAHSRRKNEETGISARALNSRKNNMRYCVYGDNYDRDIYHSGAFRNTSSKFLVEYNMNTPIKKIKEYLKTNRITGYSKVNEKNKSDWIGCIYRHADAL